MSWPWLLDYVSAGAKTQMKTLLTCTVNVSVPSGQSELLSAYNLLCHHYNKMEINYDAFSCGTSLPTI